MHICIFLLLTFKNYKESENIQTLHIAKLCLLFFENNFYIPCTNGCALAIFMRGLDGVTTPVRSARLRRISYWIISSGGVT
jgi:hypothetical protein